MSGLPVRYPLRIRQGSRVALVFTCYDDAGDPMWDLTGYDARAQVRRTDDAPDVLLELTVDNGRIVLGDDAGTVTLEVDATVTAALEPGPAVWDLELVPAETEAEAFALLAGPVEIVRQVTR